jgi:hypothetical protein
MKRPPNWLVPIGDIYDEPAKIEIDDGLNPPAVLLDIGTDPRVLTPVEAAQLGQALQDASREAARRKR